MLTHLNRFFALKPEARRLFLQAYRLLGTMRLALMATPFKRLVAGMTVNDGEVGRVALDEERLAMAHKVGWAVRTAAQFTPWNSTCLVQVLAAQRMLQRRGIAGAFYLGAATGSPGEEQPGLSAHAWLKCDDDFITGEPGHERYTVVSSFSWPVG